MVRKAGTSPQPRIPWSSSVNPTDHLSGLTLPVLCACRHVTEVQEERGPVRGCPPSRAGCPRLSSCCPDSRFLAPGAAQDVCGSAHLTPHVVLNLGKNFSLVMTCFAGTQVPQLDFRKPSSLEAISPQDVFTCHPLRQECSCIRACRPTRLCL